VDFSFPALRRLRKRREFLATQNGGARISLPSCILLLSARPDRELARLGVTVTRKFGNAVERNRAKRVMREAFRRLPEVFPHGIDLVVIPKGSSVGQLSVAGMCDEWRRATRLIATRAESLQRALAKQGEAHQTGGPKGSDV